LCMTCMTVAVVVAVAVVAMVTRAHRESYLRSGSAGCGAARGGAGQRGEAVRRGGAARCGEAVRRRDLEADVLALSVAVEPEHEVVRTLGLVLQVGAHRAARGHLGEGGG